MASDPLPQHLHEYLDSLVPPRPPEMQAMEAYAKQTDFPIIGPASGYFCYQIARMIGARRVFELGSGYGYSTAWFAQAVKENGGVVHHVVWDEGLSQKARGHLQALASKTWFSSTSTRRCKRSRRRQGRSTSSSTILISMAIPPRCRSLRRSCAPAASLSSTTCFGAGRSSIRMTN